MVTSESEQSTTIQSEFWGQDVSVILVAADCTIRGGIVGCIQGAANSSRKYSDAEKDMKVRRFATNPIISPNMDDRMGDNINGPSTIRVPGWVKNPLGKYYLYFAHHQGTYIRLAFADELDGPWRLYTPGVLDLSDSHFENHIASPDVHVLEDTCEIRMY